MKSFLQPLFLFLCLSTCLISQDHHYQLNVGFGQSGLFQAEAEPGLGAALSMEYHRSISTKTGLFVGIGGQYSSYEDQSVTAPCEFLLGDKVVIYNTTEYYGIHRTDLTLSIGLEHQLGKFTLRGSLLPTMWLADKIDARFVLDFNSGTRPIQEQELSVKPGERLNLAGPLEYIIDYTDKVRLQGEIGFTYAIEDQLQFGVAYRHGLSQYELQYKTVGICGVAGCDEVNIVNSRIDARTGHGYLTLGYSF